MSGATIPQLRKGRLGHDFQMDHGVRALHGNGVQTIDMAAAQVKLVYGTAGSGEVKVLSNALFVDPNTASAAEDLLLPPEATSKGRWFKISNTGGEAITVKEDSDTTTIVTIDAGETGVVHCNGTTWYGFTGTKGGADDFGAGGIKADVVAESTAATGVTVDGLLIKDGEVALADSKKVLFGTGGDVTMQWDGSNFDVLAAADDSVIKWGNGTNNFDQWFYGNIADSYVLWDASADELSAVGPVRVKNLLNTVSPRFELKWIAGAEGLVGVNADAHVDTLDPRFELLGTGATADDCTYYAEGGLKFETDGGDGDEIILLPHLDTSQSVWTEVTWGTDKEVVWEAYIRTGSNITNTIIWAGLKLTETEVKVTDADQVYFRYEDDVAAGNWEVVDSIGGSDTSTDTSVVGAIDTDVHLKIVIAADRTAKCYLNGALVRTTAALTDTTDFVPYIGIAADGAGAAKHFYVLGQAISRVVG